MKKIRRRYFALQLDDKDSTINGSIVAVISIDSTEKNLLRDLTNKVLLDLKLKQAFVDWRRDKIIKYTIEDLENDDNNSAYDDYYIVIVTYDDEDDGNYEVNFTLQEVTII